MAHISDIKLIRTDTTLDLSQKAEKDMGMVFAAFQFSLFRILLGIATSDS
uniref:Uncharacterized protein n=1 Tax=Setaria italica TaxID=4555 RepID=K3XRJ9_SETIT